jgi:hypothetical protein
MPESDNGIPPEEDFKLLSEFASEISASKARRESVSSQELDDAIAVTTDYLRTGWGTGGGRRLRQFICQRIELYPDQNPSGAPQAEIANGLAIVPDGLQLLFNRRHCLEGKQAD